MSDLDEIAASAGIAIVEEHSGDGDAGRSLRLDEIAASAGISIVEEHSGDEDAERSLRDDNEKPAETDISLQSQVLHLETLFSNRYTDADPDYVKVMEDNSAARPPCVVDFYVRRPREDNRNWQGRREYDGGDRRNYNYRGRRNDGWNRGYERHSGHGDYHRENRDYRHRENRDYRHSEYRDRSPHR